MDILEIIKSRRSNGLVSDTPVPRQTIEKILEAGTWAPSHYRTEPWRFFVLAEEGRKPLGDILAKIAKENMEDRLSESSQKKLEKVKEKAFRAPVIITVAVEPSENPKVIDLEESGAVYAAIQNMLLAAQSLGLSSFWRTGTAAYHPLMKELFDLKKECEILGFIYLGFPKREVPAGKRKPFSEVTKWVSSEADFDLL